MISELFIYISLLPLIHVDGDFTGKLSLSELGLVESVNEGAYVGLVLGKNVWYILL